MSVRSADEAVAACDGGADWIDVKEPARGPLGAPDLGVLREVVERVEASVPLSAAWGELGEVRLDHLAQLPGALRAIKLGLAGQAQADWRARSEEVLEALPQGVEFVATAYADHAAAVAPSPRSVLEGAISLGVRYFLIDTFDKQSGDLLEHLSTDELATLIGSANEAGIRVALAGKLRGERLATAADLGADIVGVRGAVCPDGRRSSLSAERVREVRGLLEQVEQAETDRQRDATPLTIAPHLT